MSSDFDGRMADEAEEIICRLKAAAQRPTYAELEAENARLADDLDLARDCLKRGDANDLEHTRLREIARRVCDYAGDWQGEDAFANLLDEMEAALKPVEVVGGGDVG